MFNWLRNLYNDAIGGLKDVEQWIIGAIMAVYSFFDNLINQIWAFLAQLQNWVNQLFNDVYQFGVSILHYAEYIATVTIPDVLRWAQNELGALAQYAENGLSWLTSRIEYIATWAENELNKLASWVLTNVWDPLWKNVTGLLHWIETTGAFMYDLLTHPDKLATLLGKYILGAWAELGSKFAKPFVRWLVQNMIHEAGFVGSILEDILTSIF